MGNKATGNHPTRIPHKKTGLWVAAAALLWGSVSLVPAMASGSFDLFGMNTHWKLSANYSYAVRVGKKSDRIIDTAPRWQIPIPIEFKLPESNNFDDGDRNFDRWDPVHNRITLAGELHFHVNPTAGAVVGGEAFYDRAYLFGTSRDSGQRINTYQNYRQFTSSAEHYSGRDFILGPAYIYKRFRFGNRVLDLRAGRETVAWGQSLFFSGIALAQNPSNATLATVPGATARDIIMPSTQVSFTFDLTDRLSLMGQYKLLYRSTRVNPVGSYYSRSDLVGPGAKMAYGIKNPINVILNGGYDLPPVDLGHLTESINHILSSFGLNPSLVNMGKVVPVLAKLALPNAKQHLSAGKQINVYRVGENEPRNGGQWGVGLKYALNFNTSVGLYYLDYADPNPTVKQIYGDAVIATDTDTGTKIKGSDLGVLYPTRYKVEHYDNIHLVGLALSTVAGGISWGSETIYRHGIDVLVDVNQPFNGPVPTPTRADTIQQLINGIYSFGPHLFWDSLNVAGSVGYIHAFNIKSQPNYCAVHPSIGCAPEHDSKLSFDSDAAAFSLLATFTDNSVFPGWNMSIPIFMQGDVWGHSPMSAAFGSLAGEGDYRLGVGIYFTRLNALTVGLQYSGYLNAGNDLDRPLQDRDTLAFNLKYHF